MKKKTKIFIIISACVIALLAAATAIYSGDYYRAQNVNAYLESENAVTVTKIKEGYYFDGPSEDRALIFYPGAKVEETAYAPLMSSLASRGVDCFLLKMPLRLAFFDMNKAERIVKNYEYESYYLAGHSLGGAMAADYSAKHPDKYSGLFLLAAYPSKDLSAARFPVVFIYGENDKVLNREKLKKGFSLAPAGYEKFEIRGANHSSFASYGEQKGDGKAEISAARQQSETAEIILSAVNGGA